MLEPKSLIQAFASWARKQGGEGILRDFDRLPQVPGKNSIRYYPVNFSDYGWLPKPNVNPDRPGAGVAPPALRRARDLQAE